jgi:excisionase family DNA binding protein
MSQDQTAFVGREAGLAALFGALADIPDRLAALERAEAENGAKLDALQAALPPKHATITEASRTYGVSIPTMRRWVRKGVVPALKVGKVIRVDMGRGRGTETTKIVAAERSSVRP